MELLDIVDECGIPTGAVVEREEAHRRGIRHRTSHVWLLRKRHGVTQVLLQKRSLNKDSFPGCYDTSSAGHIPAGESYLQSALRELREELGVDAQEEALLYCGQRQFEFREIFHGREFLDHQVSNVYVLWLDIEETEFSVQRSEVDSVLWMDWEQCLDMVKHKSAPTCIWMEELKMISGLLAPCDRK